MSEKLQSLVADKEHVRFPDGKLLVTVWEQYPSKDQLPGESWLEMMDRTASARETAKQDAIERAHLFSAAPDLLEALKEAFEMVDGLTMMDVFGDIWFEKAHAALAKATGEKA